MTLQKKELIKKINEIEEYIAVDRELSCGCAPTGAYDDLYEEIWRLSDELARLSHYESAEEMMNDNRWQAVADESLPFL